MNGRERHSLCGPRERQPEQSYRYNSDHCFLQPQASALAPTKMAIGTITICAATMHADIRLVPRFLFCKASFCPTKGNIRRIREVKQDRASGENQERTTALKQEGVSHGSER